MTRQEFKTATQKLNNAGYISEASVMCDVPAQCGVYFRNEKTNATFLLNFMTYNNLPV